MITLFLNDAFKLASSISCPAGYVVSLALWHCCGITSDEAAAVCVVFVHDGNSAGAGEELLDFCMMVLYLTPVVIACVQQHARAE